MTLNNIPVRIELRGGYSPYETNVELDFEAEENKVYLKFDDPDIDIKYCSCYTANTLCFNIKDLKKIVEEWDKCR
jgi:hypothetical protein